MQALIPFVALLVGCSGSHLTLLPYGYLAEPLPVYHQSQNTRTGEHAYSYVGGPSAKEEVKGLDGVTRGSYSYIDANGILQSVFYVADEGGFRVAATNLPSDDDLHLQTANVLLARNVQEEAANSHSRRRRSPEQPDQNSNQNDQVVKDSKGSVEQAETLQAGLVYQSPESVFIPKLLATATSHQSQVQIHRNVQVEEGEKLVKIEEPSVIAESEESRKVEIEKNLGVQVPEAQLLLKAGEPVEVVHTPISPILPLAPLAPITYSIESLPIFEPLPVYQENRIELHKSLGIEGAAAKDAVKIKAEPLALVEAPAALPVVPSVLAKESVAPVKDDSLPLVREVPLEKALEPASASVTTTISSHGVSQIHGDSKVKVATAPIILVNEPARSALIPDYQPVVRLPLLHALPYARAAHYRTQIHNN